jgi:hypothetical protein
MTALSIDTTGMNPAQKAWATRRAQGWQPKAIRSETTQKLLTIEAAPRPRAEPQDWMKPQLADDRNAMTALTEFEMVELYVDDAAVGCGLRRFIVLDRGPHKARLFCASPMATIIVDRSRLDEFAVPARKVRRDILTEVIHRNIAIADRVNDKAMKNKADDGGVYAVRALALLAGEGAR